LTRAELAQRLALTDGKVATLRTQLKDEERRLMRTREKLTQISGENATLQQHLSEAERDLAETQHALAATHQKLAAAAQRLAAGEEQIARLEKKLEREGEQRLELQGEIAALEARLDAEASKAEELQDSVARAVAARSRAELELQFAQEELEALRKRSVPRTSPESDTPVDRLNPDS
jgi:chromosome segregation ATPase